MTDIEVTMVSAGHDPDDNNDISRNQCLTFKSNPTCSQINVFHLFI